jgi:glycosyltransferase involved in cell wall biosynthesis
MSYWKSGVMMKPRFTFCIPNLNKIDYLPACIDSMLAQDCGDWQCVFVDGFSTDGCWEYMQQFQGDHRFRILRGLKQGMYADWNECLQYVDTEYFYILTSDDTCYPELVSKTVQALDSTPDIDVCHFKFAFIDHQGQLLQLSPETAKLQFPLYAPFYDQVYRRKGIIDFLAHFVYGALYTTITSLVFRRRIIDKMQGFSPNYGSISDYDWTMRLGLYSDVLYIPELLATWRKYDGQADSQTENLVRRRNELDIAKKNLDLMGQMCKFSLLVSRNSITSGKILSNLQDGYTSAIYYQQSRNLSDLSDDALSVLMDVVSQDPLYILRKLLRRISANKLFSYHPDFMLMQLFEDLHPEWQPSVVELSLSEFTR